MLSRLKNNLSIWRLTVLVMLIVVLIFAVDFIRISGYKTIKSLPENKKKANVYSIYLDLLNNSDVINWNLLDDDINYIRNQYDVADFYIATMLRIVNDYNKVIPADKMAEIKKTLLGFRYWMDEPGENGMCYWSENHQILFASAEYIVGQMYSDEIFTNDGLTGKQHMQKARKRILDWLEMRWKFGFSEFYSTVYYNEDIAGLINLIDYAKDEEIVKISEIIMDLLIYDIATQKVGNMFVSVSGRAYKNGRMGGQRLSSKMIINSIWGGETNMYQHINLGFLSRKKYSVPPVLIAIGNDSSDVIIKQSNGLNISQLKQESYYGTDERSIMMQWGMEAFVNPEIVRNSLHYIRKNNMFSNEFLNPLKNLDYSYLKIFRNEPGLVKFINPQDQGTAMQRANTYTYKTKDYSIYSVQNYFPGFFADQIHVSGMNIKNHFSIFHNHPAVNREVESKSPDYWVGYGRLPHVAQDSSISLSIYNLPAKKETLEMDMLHFTHAYFPKENFDTVIVEKNYALGKKGNTYCALIAKNNLSFREDTNYDLIQKGKQTFWIIEAGSKEKDGSFEKFKNRIFTNKILFDTVRISLTYFSNGKKLKLFYGGNFYVNRSKVETNYMRYDSPYVKSKFKPDRLEFKSKNKSLFLDFKRMQRIFN